MATDAPIVDQYSGLDHKPVMAEGLDSAPGYLDSDQKRRITAYFLIRAYLESVAREWLANDTLADEWREFGDPAVYVSRIAAAVLGEDPTVAVVGADASIPDVPDLPPFPEEPPEGLDPVEAAVRQAIHQAAVDRWKAAAEQIQADWLDDLTAGPLLDAHQEWLRQRVEDDQLIAKITEAENEFIVPLGDGIFVQSWDPDTLRSTTEIYEPDVYFPVLDDAQPSQFPNKVHLAWNKIVTGPDGKDQELVRRITYELVRREDLEAAGLDAGDQPGYLDDPNAWTHVCLLTDATWPIDAFDTIDGIAQGGTYREIADRDGNPIELNQYPTGYDFVPVVHVPHTVSSTRHFGRSPIPRVAQLLDEVAASDADESKNSRWAAQPPVAISGMGPVPRDDNGDPLPVPISPGDGYAVSDNGKVTAVNMAEELATIGDRIAALLKRLSVNFVVPEGLVGRIDAAEVPSGLALTLSFTAFQQMIIGARLARAAKYPLILKQHQRISIHHGVTYAAAGQQDPILAANPTVYPAELRFGSFMPQDQAGIGRLVAELLAAFGISTETGVLMLQSAGFPIDDVAAEVAKIRETMGEVANFIADATEDLDLARAFLGAPKAAPTAGPDPTGPVTPPPPAPGFGVNGLPATPPAPAPQ